MWKEHVAKEVQSTVIFVKYTKIKCDVSLRSVPDYALDKVVTRCKQYCRIFQCRAELRFLFGLWRPYLRITPENQNKQIVKVQKKVKKKNDQADTR